MLQVGSLRCSNPRIPWSKSPAITRSYVPDLTCYVQRQFDCSYIWVCSRRRRWRRKNNKGTGRPGVSRCSQESLTHSLSQSVIHSVSHSFSQSACWPKPSQAVEREISFVWWTEVNEQWSSARWRWCHMTCGGAASGAAPAISATDWWRELQGEKIT